MGTPKIIAVVPCRAGSERVKDKNTRPFAGHAGGLLELKLHQLLQVGDIEIVVTSNDIVALDIASHLGVRKQMLPGKASKSTDSLIAWIPEMLADEPDDTVILWTHVTSPLFDEDCYRRAIEMYYAYVEVGNHDSLMTAKRIQDFLWRGEGRGPINYTRSAGNYWPRTQDTTLIWQITGAAFMAPLSVYREEHDRIGINPAMMEVSPLTGIEVDTEGDFEFAEAMVKHRARGETRS